MSLFSSQSDSRTQPSSPSNPALANLEVVRIQNLELRAKVIVEGFMSGLHRSPYHGFSVEFTDYRQYTPGDDLRYLDWKLLARADRKYIKRFEDETNLRSYLLVDFSKSMAYRGPNATCSKIHYAQSIAAALAYFLNRQRDAVGVLTFADQVLDTVPPRFRSGHLRRLMLALDRNVDGASTNLSIPLTQLTNLMQKRGLVFLLSDYLAPVDNLQQDLSYLRSIGHDVILLRVLDPSETDLKLEQSVMFRDMETGKQIYVDPESASKEYRQRFLEHEQQIQQVCAGLGVNYLPTPTDVSFNQLMIQLVQLRSQLAAGRGGSRDNLASATPVGEREFKGGTA